MTTPDSPPAAAPIVDREDDIGAPASPPPGRGAASAPSDQWRAMMTLGAMIAVWEDLSVGLRRSIAADAMGAMRRAEPCDDSPDSPAFPQAAKPRRNACRRPWDARQGDQRR